MTNKEQSNIPIENIWLLLFYGSGMLEHATIQKNVKIEEKPDDIPILMAEILSHAVKHRIRKNLNFGYQSRQEILNRVRGRIDLLRTEKNQLLEKAQIACRFEELTIDTPRNRFVRDALDEIAILVLLHTNKLQERNAEKESIQYNQNLANSCRSLAMSLRRSGVTGVRPTRREILSERFGRNDANDRLMVLAALLAFDLALPTESIGGSFLPKIERDIGWLSALFEKGVAGFYNFFLTSHGWKIQAQEWVNWQRCKNKETAGIKYILPNMRADIILTKGSERQIIIDTKFKNILTQNKGTKIESRSIYQIYAYLRSREKSDCKAIENSAEGILLHPSIGHDVDEFTTIQNHKIGFATVDLNASASKIRERLIEIIEPNQPIS